MHFIGIRMLLNRLRMVPYYLKDKTVPWYRKALMILCIAYIVVPIDFVPVFPFDDLFLFVFMMWNFKDELDTYWKGEKPVDLSKKFRDKDIVEGVEFTVEDDEDPGRDS